VAGHPITPQAGRTAVEEAAERPYDRAIAHLRNSHRIGLGKELLIALTQTVGEYWLEQDRQTFTTARARRETPTARLAPRQCLIFADGVMVHTDGDWREIRVGTVRSEMADSGPFKSSIARRCSVNDFGDDLWRKACEMGYREAEVRAFVSDGSHWLWNQQQRWFSNAVPILDFWHLCDHVATCGGLFFGEGSGESRHWFETIKTRLRAGQTDEALAAIEALNPRRSKSCRKAKHELITYIENNRDRMDYPRYERLGLPIGSGEVEAQCKSLVQQRCKQSGMRWQTRGLESLLRVRCAVRDGSYDCLFGRWPTDLVAWRIRKREKAA